MLLRRARGRVAKKFLYDYDMKVSYYAKDPGGANAIAPVIALLKASGETVDEMLADPDIFIGGTSAGDTPDKKLVRTLGGVPSVYVLDFWLNYWQRFSTTGIKDFAYMPTKICIMDDTAKEEMLAEGFPAERLAVTGNPHFDHFADRVTHEGEERERILFLSQPLRATADISGFAPVASDEYAVLEDSIASLASLPEHYFLSIRLHPKEPRDKYQPYFGARVRMADEPTLEEAMSHSGLIIGISSPTIMQATAAGKKALSYEPKLAGKDPLVSNRVGVTTRIVNKEALKDAFMQYGRGTWPFKNRPMREVWPAGATERVVEVVRELANLP